MDQHYSEFLTEEDTVQFELDMENNKYTEWVTRYPDHKYGILEALAHFNGLSENTVSEFLALGVDIDHVYSPSQLDGDTLLTRACRVRDIDAVGWLLRLGANPNIKSSNGHTPFVTALLSNNDEIDRVLSILEEAGADMTIPKKWEYVRWESHYNSDAINKYMWPKGKWDYMSKSYARYSDTQNVFEDAIENEDFDFFVFCLQKRQVAPEGLVSRLAYHHECDDFLQALLAFGADATENGGTPLWNAVTWGQRSKYDLLKLYTTKCDIFFESEEQEKRFDECLSLM